MPDACSDPKCGHNKAAKSVADMTDVAEQHTQDATDAAMRGDVAAARRHARHATRAAGRAAQLARDLKDCTALHPFVEAAAHHATNLAADARTIVRAAEHPDDLRLEALAMAAGADISARRAASELIGTGASQRKIELAYRGALAAAMLAGAQASQADITACLKALAAGASEAEAIKAGRKAGDAIIERADRQQQKEAAAQ